jgi:DNA-binding response OmpR family regulator
MAKRDCSVGVLVVEDDVLIAINLATMLADLGFSDIRLAHDLAAGRALLLSRMPGLAILDVNVGGRLVFPLATELRARQIPIVFSTGRRPSELPPEWALHPILPKPMDPDVLTATLEALGLP